MGIATVVRKALRLLLWGFDRRLHRARFAAIDEAASITANDPPPVSLLLAVNRFKHFFLVRPTKTPGEVVLLSMTLKATCSNLPQDTGRHLAGCMLLTLQATATDTIHS